MASNLANSNLSVTNDDILAIAPESNVLPTTATRDEIDVHWIFNFEEADIAPAQSYSVYDQAILGRRVQTSKRNVTPAEPSPSQCEAARRSSRVRRVLGRLSHTQVNALARWAAPPKRAHEAVRAIFGRLSFVTALTEGFEEIGSTDAFIKACVRAQGKRDKEDGTVNFLRHAARVKLAVVKEQAEEVLRDAFAAYARERGWLDDEAAAIAAQKAARRAPALTEIMAMAAATTPTADAGDGASALAKIMAAASND